MLTPAQRQKRYRDKHRERVNEEARLAERTKRAADPRIRAAIAKRPRCMICNNPIRYGKTGVRYDSKTCGSKTCQNKRFKWFVR